MVRNFFIWRILMPDKILHALVHCLIETAKMAPIIFLAYLFMEWLEHTNSTKLTNKIHKARSAGPLIGSALGLIQQCGFSGAIAGMYAAGTVTMGALLAVILATSDEMLVIMLPDLGGRITPLLLIFILVYKFVVGIAVGFVADFILKKRHAQREEDIHGFCERENCSCKDGVWLSAVKHTIKVLLIVYIVSVVLHILIELVPEDAIKTVLNFPVLSEIGAALAGLIPSCAVSVTLTQLYVEGALGIGPLLCGLLTNGGVGLLVLYRVNKRPKDNLIITLILFISGLLFGSLAGVIMQ